MTIVVMVVVHHGGRQCTNADFSPCYGESDCEHDDYFGVDVVDNNNLSYS